MKMAYVFVLALVLAVPIPGRANSPENDPGWVGKEGPSFLATDIAGQSISSSDLYKSGKIVVVNFWGLRCSACIEEIPHLNNLQDRYGDRALILGVNVDGIDAEVLGSQIRKSKLAIRYPVLPDPEFKLGELFKLTAAPLTIIVDGGGIVRFQHENFGPGDEKKLEEVVRRLVEGKPVVLR